MRDREEAYSRHIEDSLALVPVLDECLNTRTVSENQGRRKIIDVGSGAGLPGLILGIVRPQWDIVLLDSLKKRCTFNSAAIEAVGVSNVDVQWGRAEDLGHLVAHRETYDIAVARAVAELRILAEYCLPFVKVGGHWVAAKGPDPEPEVEAAQKAIGLLGGTLCAINRVESCTTHTGEAQKRTAVIIKKSRITPKKFPRKPGSAKKQPI